MNNYKYLHGLYDLPSLPIQLHNIPIQVFQEYMVLSDSILIESLNFKTQPSTLAQPLNLLYINLQRFTHFTIKMSGSHRFNYIHNYPKMSGINRNFQLNSISLQKPTLNSLRSSRYIYPKLRCLCKFKHSSLPKWKYR